MGDALCRCDNGIVPDKENVYREHGSREGGKQGPPVEKPWAEGDDTVAREFHVLHRECDVLCKLHIYRPAETVARLEGDERVVRKDESGHIEFRKSDV